MRNAVLTTCIAAALLASPAGGQEFQLPDNFWLKPNLLWEIDALDATFTECTKNLAAISTQPSDCLYAWDSPVYVDGHFKGVICQRGWQIEISCIRSGGYVWIHRGIPCPLAAKGL